MVEIRFDAAFGEEVKKVELSHDQYGGEGYSLHINRFYKGVFLYRYNAWTFYSIPNNELTLDDIQILTDIILTDLIKKAP